MIPVGHLRTAFPRQFLRQRGVQLPLGAKNGAVGACKGYAGDVSGHQCFLLMINLGKFDHDLTTTEPWNHGFYMGNHPQMAARFRLVNYYGLPRLILGVIVDRSLSTEDFMGIYGGISGMKKNNIDQRLRGFTRKNKGSSTFSRHQLSRNMKR